MGGRRELKRPKYLIDKYGEKFAIWSYSRLNTLHNCQHEYYLSRIKKIKGEDNIYNLCGSYAHDILEDLYNNKIDYKDMANIFENNFLEVEIYDYRFSSDDEIHFKRLKKYKSCIVDFFEKHQKVNSKVLTEKEVWIDVNGNVFIGYVDAIHKECDNYIITDYKTSSISEFNGVKLLEKQQQLLLYALGLSQLGIPLSKIKIRWNFLKYTNVKYKHMLKVTYEKEVKDKEPKQTTSCVNCNELVVKIKTQLTKDIKTYYPNMKPKEIKGILSELIIDNSLEKLPKEIQDKYIIEPVVKSGERCKWVESIKTQLKKDLKEYGYSDIEIEMILIECIDNNSLATLPEEIYNNYLLEDCYIYGQVTTDNINQLCKTMSEDIEKIQSKGASECNWKENKVTNKDTYYCNVLCGVKRHCKYYNQYIEELKIQDYNREDIDILTQLENL